MYIKSIVLDGFKSYGERTVIDGFDPKFNAITGLNGTGKSNILDSICFVLGITQLSNVRVTSLQDLVYKSGQSGITKATVSITFDNLDKNQCPVGFQDYDEITITRQVVVGGKNKYLINGTNVQNKRVHDLFCSVQLNVNNPHFLIMQGRITKVLNMKPPEILSMIEEAAGTAMYEEKKQNATKNIAKKDAKLKEINDVADEEIIPKLNRLREERKTYFEYQRIERELENLLSMYLAWQYVQAKKAIKNSLDELKAKTNEIDDMKNDINTNKSKAADIDKEVEEHQQKDAGNNEKVQTLEATVKEKEKTLAGANAADKTAKNNLQTEEKRKKQLIKNLNDDKTTLVTKEKEMSEMDETFKTLKENEAADSAAYLTSQKKYEAICAGMDIGDDGEAATLEEQLIKAKQDATEAGTRVKQCTMELKNNETQFKEKQGSLGSTATDYKKDKLNMENLEKNVKNLQTNLKGLNYDENERTSLQETKRKLTYECRGIRERLELFESRYPQIQFKYQDPEPNFNKRSVIGLVCNVFNIKDRIYALALETIAGGRLFNVITDTEHTSKKLLQRGQLRHRTTFIPLNKIKGNAIPDKMVQYAQNLVGEDNVKPALSLLKFNKDLQPAMEFIFGSAFICRDMNVARKIAFDKNILRKCVTLDGDVVDPAGILSGGARNESGSFLLKLDEYKELQTHFTTKEQELMKMDNQIQKMEGVVNKYMKLKQQYDIALHEMAVVQKRLQQTSHYQLQEEVDNLKRAIAELNEEIKTCKEKEKTCSAKAKQIESEIKNSKTNREGKLKQAENEMNKLKKQADNSKNLWAEKEQYYETVKLEIVELRKAITNGEKEIELCETCIEDCRNTLEQTNAAATEAKEIVTKYQAEYKSQKALITSKNKDIHKKLQQKADLLAQVSEIELEIKKKSHSMKELQTKCNDFESKEKELQKRLKKDDNRIKDAEIMNDNEGHELGRRVAKAQEMRNKLSRNVNFKAQSMFDHEEKQYIMLMKQKDTIEKDKKTLFNLIDDLDKQKINFLTKALEKISKDFGSIFSTLLPGTDAKLKPADGKNILDGLEIKIGIGGIWKENLTELSGGQKSLVALSLILSMLLFRPAPLYILDEVDAALDLSHTQNIGKMLRMHFKHSQFIIVSLKDGMFNNANVLFRTRFDDGISKVQRTANPNPN